MKLIKTLLTFSIIAALVAGIVLYFRDTDAPKLTLSPANGAVSGKTAFSLIMEDNGAGLKDLSVVVKQGEQSYPLLVKSYEKGQSFATEEFSLQALKLKDGPITVQVSAADHSIYHFGAGNVVQQDWNFELDRQPPLVTSISTSHNFNQGGAGLVVYTVSEDVQTSGVQLGDMFFPGYKQPSGQYLCLLAFPWNQKPSSLTPRLVATDIAGNERQAGFYYHVNPKSFPKDNVNISDNFLNSKMPEFSQIYPEISNDLDLFLKVNSELRQQNRSRLHELAKQTSTTPQWSPGSFERQPKSSTPGVFGDDRTYYYQGQKIDRQTHLGVDLASTAQAPIFAATSGTVILAEYFGIYGLCVIIDHGIGLQTLYGHLSQTDVQVGSSVQKGTIIGRSGATGLAGGDHLHFGVLVSGLPVQPLEWWDDTWVKNNISSKLELLTGNQNR